jgi:phage/plasmid-like protein (TIGR03299 family)
MSKESAKWLNRNVLVGFTAENGEPWWYKKEFQGEESTVYPGAIPVADVERRLFDWEAIRSSLYMDGENGQKILIPNLNAIVHSKTGHVFQVPKSGYVIHQYREWLIENARNLLDQNDLQIGSAGLLRKGGGAFVTIERPETITSRSGVEIRPRLLCATSHDSKLASIYKFVAQIVVCDNTLEMALAENEPEVRRRHTMHSVGQINLVREKLNMMIAGSEKIVNLIDTLSEIKVSDAQWSSIVEQLVPIPPKSRGQLVSRMLNKRELLDSMWRTDPRCAPWNGSGFGVFQTFNTYRLHKAGSDASRLDRNMRNILSSNSLKEDRSIFAAIKSATGLAINN